MFIRILLVILHQIYSPWNYCVSSDSLQSSLLLEKNQSNKLLKKLSKEKLEKRILFWSEFFKRVPYGIDPTGEGYGIDDDPIFNPCVLDCETYVEQTLALSFSENFNDVIFWLKKMRYKEGKISLKNRFYTMALSWIPGNLKIGYLYKQKLTRKRFFVSRKVFPKGKWKSVHKKRFELMGENAPKGIAKVEYIPIDVLIDKYNQVKTPAVAFIVRVKQAGNPFLITHMGLILRNKKGKLIFRHASKSRKKVVELKLINYLLSLKKYFNDSKKPRRFVAGLAIYQIKNPAK